MLNKKQLLIASMLIILAAIPATLLMQQEPQDTRTRATASTTLTYTPDTTGTTPLLKAVGEPVSVDIIVTPGSNLPSLVKLEMMYDAGKFEPAATPFTVNTASFPTTVEGPVMIDGKILIAVSIGSDSTKAIQKPTKVGTLNLIAKAPTEGTPTQLTFGTQTQVLSLGLNDESTENVLATTQPSYVTIEGTASSTTIASLSPTVETTPTPSPTETPTPTPAATATQGPTLEPTQTLIPTQTPMPTPTINPLSTSLSFNVYMHGVGNSGDNANPTATDLSNKAPQQPSRTVTVFVYDDQNQLAATASGFLNYDVLSGSFKGIIDVGTSVTQGDYTIRLKEETHLRRIIPGIQQLQAQSTNTMPVITLVAGDVNGDNTLNILDYNLIVGCYSDLLPAVSCTPQTKITSDINDNGQVNQFDYNLFLREITVQSGN